MSKMFLIVHNPLSNNRKSKKTTNKMVRFFKRHQIPFILRSSLKIDNLTEYLETNPQLTDILYLGGDGSINYLINSVDISQIKPKIYLSKSGSGNDFLRSLKQIGSGNISIGEAITNQKSTRFINGCGIGIDALVCHYVNNDTKRNKLSYFVNVFRSVIKYERSTVEVIVDGISHVFEDTYFVAIQNGRFFGGGMYVAPGANIENDDYVVCVAHNLNKFLIQFMFLSIYVGLHTKIKKRITMLKGKEIIVKVKEPKYFQADGEVIADITEMTVRKAVNRQFTAFNKKEILKELKTRENG